MYNKCFESLLVKSVFFHTNPDTAYTFLVQSVVKLQSCFLNLHWKPGDQEERNVLAQCFGELGQNLNRVATMKPRTFRLAL